MAELTEAAEALFGGARPHSVAEAIGRASASYALADDGVYRIFRTKGLRHGVAGFLESTGGLYKLYYDVGELRVDSVSNQDARCTLVQGGRFPECITVRIVAFLVRGLELVGAKSAQIDRKPKGDDVALSVQWISD